MDFCELLPVILRVQVVQCQQDSSLTETKWEGFLQHMVLPPEGASSQNYEVLLDLCLRVCEPHVSCMGDSRATFLHFLLMSQK